jgi:hypothetical protein
MSQVASDEIASNSASVDVETELCFVTFQSFVLPKSLYLYPCVLLILVSSANKASEYPLKCIGCVTDFTLTSVSVAISKVGFSAGLLLYSRALNRVKLR